MTLKKCSLTWKVLFKNDSMSTNQKPLLSQWQKEWSCKWVIFSFAIFPLSSKPVTFQEEIECHSKLNYVFIWRGWSKSKVKAMQISLSAISSNLWCWQTICIHNCYITRRALEPRLRSWYMQRRKDEQGRKKRIENWSICLKLFSRTQV